VRQIPCIWRAPVVRKGMEAESQTQLIAADVRGALGAPRTGMRWPPNILVADLVDLSMRSRGLTAMPRMVAG
jgi:hypothetical protein